MVTVQQLNGVVKKNSVMCIGSCSSESATSQTKVTQGVSAYLAKAKRRFLDSSQTITLYYLCLLNFHSKNYSFYLQIFSFIFIRNQVCSIYNCIHQRMFAKHTYIQSISSTALPISGKTPISRKKKQNFLVKPKLH
jgi:hypothetical protein